MLVRSQLRLNETQGLTVLTDRWTAELEEYLRAFRRDTRHLRKQAGAFLHSECDDESDGLEQMQANFRGIYGTSVSKLSVACLHIQRAVKARDHLAYTTFSRLLVEQTAMLMTIVFKVGKAYVARNEEFSLRTEELHFTMVNSLIGARFDWRSFFENGITGMSRLKTPQTNYKHRTLIGALIADWTKLEPTIGVLYGLLCDAVHPNVGGNLLFFQVKNGQVGFSAAAPSPMGDLILWNTFPHVRHVQDRAVGALGALWGTIEKGLARRSRWLS